MSRRNALVALRQMLEFAAEARDLVDGFSFESFSSDRRTQLAAVYALLVVGEAANRVEREILARYPAVRWSDIIGFRHRLVLGYDAIQLDVVWTTLATDIPDLIEKLRRVLEAESGA